MCPSWIRPQRGLGVAPGSLVITSFLLLQVTTFQSLLGLSRTRETFGVGGNVGVAYH